MKLNYKYLNRIIGDPNIFDGINNRYSQYCTELEELYRNTNITKYESTVLDVLEITYAILKLFKSDSTYFDMIQKLIIYSKRIFEINRKFRIINDIDNMSWNRILPIIERIELVIKEYTSTLIKCTDYIV